VGISHPSLPLVPPFNPSSEVVLFRIPSFFSPRYIWQVLGRHYRNSPSFSQSLLLRLISSSSFLSSFNCSFFSFFPGTFLSRGALIQCSTRPIFYFDIDSLVALEAVSFPILFSSTVTFHPPLSSYDSPSTVLGCNPKMQPNPPSITPLFLVCVIITHSPPPPFLCSTFHPLRPFDASFPN